MRLYLLRHADAIESNPDAARPLSSRGGEQIDALAGFLARSGAFEPAEIWHSTLRRARETADLLARGAKLTAPRVETSGLEPDTDPRLVAGKLAVLQRDIAIVGHEPHLSALAAWLVTGTTARPAFVLKKCTMVALEREGSFWLVRWQISPELLG